MKTGNHCFKTWIKTGLACIALAGGVAHAAAGDGPPTRIIVKWKEPAVEAFRSPADRQAAAEARAQRRAEGLAHASSRVGVALSRLRTIATGAESIVPGRRLTRTELDEVIATLAADPDVEYVERDILLQPLLTPNDTRYNEQWHYFEAAAGIRAPAAWERSTGAGAVVAVVDTGYRPHADLAANIVGGYDLISDSFVANDGNGRDSDARDPGDWAGFGDCSWFSPSRPSSWHGTHVAGTVAAVGNNGYGVTGVAFGARVVPVRVLGRCGGLMSDIADGVIWAAGGAVSGAPLNPNPAKVINLSLGGPGSCSATMQAAIDAARARGALVVAAAGNDGGSANNVTPGSCSGVLTVASINRNGGRASYSNYGSVVEVAAPGGDTAAGSANGVLSTLNAGTTSPGADTYAFYQGTSMAAPHVAGVAALMVSANPSLTPDQLANYLRTTTRPFPASCSGCGSGIVDANAAVLAVGGSNPDPDPDPDPAACPAGYTERTGSVTSGGVAYVPGSSGYSAGSGTHSGRLSGPSGTNFNLTLQRRYFWSWITASSSTTSGSDESIDYSGIADTYRWVVSSASGSGAFTLCTRTP